MKNGKSPGNDGLTKGFNMGLFCETASPLIESLNHSFSVGDLSTSRRQAVTLSIEKKGTDLSKIEDLSLS